MSAATPPPPSVLPRYLSRFIGRAVELEALHRRLAAERGRSSPERLIVLLGPGGIGKTRLAVEAASRAVSARGPAPRYPDGVWWVDCTSLVDRDSLLHALARAAGLPGQTGPDLSEALRRRVRQRRALVVLDNCEHLSTEITTVGTDLVTSGPGMTVLATSRVPIEASTSLPVHPLDCERGGPDGSSEASELFCDRAGHAAPGARESGGADPSVIDAICRQVGGIPLAIELAAPWVRTLSASDLRRHLDHSLELLVTEDTEVPERHRAMRAVLDSTWALLSPWERSTLRDLGLFVGGFGLDAADRVVGASLRDLSSLTARGLIRRVPQPNDDTWFEMHELLRQYVGEHRRARPAVDLRCQQQRRVDHLVGVAESFERARSGPDENLWFDRLTRELPNVDAALDWALEQGDGDLVLPLLARMGNVWIYGGAALQRHDRVIIDALGLPWDEGSEALLVARRRVSYLAGWTSFGQHDREGARGHFQESLALSRRSGPTRDDDLEAVCLRALSRIAVDDGDSAEADRLARQSLAVCQRAGLELGIAWSYAHLAEAAFAAGDLKLTEARLVHSVGVFAGLGDRFGEAMICADLADLRRRSGRRMAALEAYDRAASVARRSSATAVGRNLLRGVAALAYAAGLDDRAAELFGACDTWALVHGAWDGVISCAPETERAACRTRLGEAAWAVAYEQGARLPDDQVSLVIEQTIAACRTALDPPAGLTAREREIVDLLDDGLSNEEIASRLRLSVRTVHAHLRSIFRKLEVTSRTAAVHRARLLGVVAVH